MNMTVYRERSKGCRGVGWTGAMVPKRMIYSSSLILPKIEKAKTYA